MINNRLRDYLVTNGLETAGVFNCPSYDNSIVGYTSDGAVVYDYERMILEYMSENQCSRIEAIEFIDYNTIRSIPYMHRNMIPPVIMYPCELEEDSND